MRTPLTFEAAKTEASKPEDSRGPSKPLRERKVLVVDDDARNLFAVTTLLESQGAEALSAGNAREGLELLERRSDVDTVLMDVMMPEIDGYEAVRRIRAVPRRSRLPIVALTAKAMPGDRERCLRAGFDDFLAKPIEVKNLVEAVRRARVRVG